MSTKPTLIFIPGGWHTAAVWDKVIHLLEPQGYTCIAINLPSCSSDPCAAFKDDIQAVRTVILSETNDKNHNVVLVAWSYGGHVASSAMKGLTSSTTATTATATTTTTTTTPTKPHGRILALALIASGFAQTGVGFFEAAGDALPPYIKLDDTTGFAALAANPTGLFYHDLPAPEAQYWSSQLTNLSLKALAEGGEDSYAGWKDLPVWFLIPTGDRALPPEVQRGFVRGARELGGAVRVREVEGAGHAVMLGREGEVVRFLGEVVGAVGG